MALIVYNKENSRPQQVVYQGKRTINMDSKGTVYLSKTMSIELGILGGGRVNFAHDEDTGEWYICHTTDKDRFTVWKDKGVRILCRIHRQKNHASGKSGKEDRTVYDCQSSHRGGRYSILQDSAFQSDFQIARRWLRKIHYQIMVMDFSGLCCLDFYIILFGALGYCLVRALYWHNTMS